jgi:hypothetical protein
VPSKPGNLDPLAEKVLDALTGRPEAAEIVLGGYVALQHYADYRATHDLDAWWRISPSAGTEQAIREVMQQVARATDHQLGERRFGETISFELRRNGKKRFSFQIAVRSVELEPPVASAWPPILIETLRDNIGAKMNALVERGAARDFVDIRHVVTSGLTTPAECWALWGRKNPGQPVESAREKVLFHLGGLEARRPLAAIRDSAERARAKETREWFRREFLGIDM